MWDLKEDGSDDKSSKVTHDSRQTLITFLFTDLVIVYCRETIIIIVDVVIVVIIIIIIVQGIEHSRPVPIQNLTSELCESVEHLVGLLGRGISPMQNLYQHSITQYRKT
jgi:hypothetical protein